jgi:hypothetical protein
MTNGAGGPHVQKRSKRAAGKKTRGKDTKASLKRKGWLPTGLAKEKND